MGTCDRYVLMRLVCLGECGVGSGCIWGRCSKLGLTAREWVRRGERHVIKPFDYQARFLDCVHWRWDVTKMCLFKSDPFVCFDELRDIRGRK